MAAENSTGSSNCIVTETKFEGEINSNYFRIDAEGTFQTSGKLVGRQTESDKRTRFMKTPILKVK